LACKESGRELGCGFEEAEALDLAEALATQVLERFEAYV
jgi:hypothetical protein